MPGLWTVLIRSRRRAAVGLSVALALVTGTGWLLSDLKQRADRRAWESQEYEPAPPGMVFVPAGEFIMGSDELDADPDERPRRLVFNRAFYIDRFEVTNRRFREFRSTHRFPPGEEDFPVTHVLKSEAEAFCRWAHGSVGRLPSDLEWERAARGIDGRRYPWGDRFEPSRANVRSDDARNDGGSNRVAAGVCRRDDPLQPSVDKKAVGSFPLGVSPSDCQDMAGNVWEWVADEWVDSGRWFFGVRASAQEKRGILRGGAARYGQAQARTSHRGFENLNATCHDVGFRCAMDAIPKGHP